MSGQQEDDRHTRPEQRSFCARLLRSIRARARTTVDPSEKERLDREVKVLREKAGAPS